MIPLKFIRPLSWMTPTLHPIACPAKENSHTYGLNLSWFESYSIYIQI